MLKKLLILAFAGLLSPVYAAGTVPGFSLTPQYDLAGKIAPGCKLYIIQAGTVSTPQNGYQDSGLSILAANPLTCDATGRLPQFFLADGTIKFRLTDKNGVQIFTQDGLLVVGPSSGGGGGGGSVDPTTVLATGDVKTKYGTGVLTGFVRLNGRTIGSATSGATERANADAQALFEYLWQTDANLAVSTGRGASSNADWVANKTIALPDGRGVALAGLDDMGNSAKSVFSGATFTSGNATTLGSILGAARRTLQIAQVPVITPTGNISVILFGGSSTIANIVQTNGSIDKASDSNTSVTNIYRATDSRVLNTAGSTFTGNSFGGGQAFDAISPYLLVTTYIKL